MQAIQTEYMGYRFRSRLEARWATFFNAANLDWQYEVEGFELPNNGFYLPDFKIISPFGLDQWYEVKPKGVEFDAKFSEFQDNLECSPLDGYYPDSCLLSGDPVDFFFNGGVICPCCGRIMHSDKKDTMKVPDWWGTVAAFCRCDIETQDDFFGPRQLRKKGKYLSYTFGYGTSDKEGDSYRQIYSVHEYNEFADAVIQLAIKARQARFEHGESGIIL